MKLLQPVGGRCRSRDRGERLRGEVEEDAVPQVQRMEARAATGKGQERGVGEGPAERRVEAEHMQLRPGPREAGVLDVPAKGGQQRAGRAECELLDCLELQEAAKTRR